MTFTDLIQDLGSDPVVRGRQFERLCRWYLQNDPEYHYRLRNVWLWNEWPGRWGPDAGIDLVAQTHEGDIWAIQAKAYEPTYSIKKSDVDTFLSESNRPEIAYRLLVATTDGIGVNAYRTLVSQEKPVGLVLRSHLETADVEWPSDLGVLAPTKRPPLSRLPHQQEAIDDALAGFGSTDRGQLIMACGTGKTLVALWVAEDLGSERTMVLVPSLTLLSQTLREWTANASQPFDYLAVCSDVTVAEQDAMVSRTADLGLPVTTDAAAVESFLRRDGRRVIFATYQSSPRIAEAHVRGAPPFDVVVADEGHRCTGPTTTEFTAVLDGDQIRSRRRLFMTATPRYFSDRIKKVAGEADYEVASMDDEDRFGPVFHRLTFGEAIQRDLLSDYIVLVVGVDEDTYHRYVERGEFVTPDGQRVTDARTLASHIGLAKAMRDYDLTRTISFHGRVNKARAFSSAFPAVVDWMPVDERPSGRIWGRYVSGEMPTGDRDRRLGQFRNLDEGTRGLLSNARCLAEGVDVPTIDGITFIDPRRSTIDIIQAVGRAIRKSPEKRVGVVVLPVFVTDEENPEKALEDSSFKPVWDVLKAMRAHDEVLAETLDGLRRSLGRQRGVTVGRPMKIVLDLPAKVGEEFARAFDVRLVVQTTAPWEFWFGLLERYVERQGDALVPAGHKEDGFSLGPWIHKQRGKWKVGKLEPERQRRLAALKGWVWDALVGQWEEGFAKLERYVEREGDARVPASHIEDGFKLGPWVIRQRTSYTRHKLEPERQRRVEALRGWVWDTLVAQWEEGFAKLQRYVEREGNALVLRDHVEDRFNLGQWVTTQRASYTRHKLEPERQRRLEALRGWVWDTLVAQWEEGFTKLQRYVEREGNALVLRAHIEDDFHLGEWVIRQRAYYKRRDLNPERQRRLAALKGWVWDARVAQWEEGFAKLQRYVEREGDAGVPGTHIEDGFKLGWCVIRNRRAYKAGKLELERQRRLEALRGWVWDTLVAQWEEGFAKLRRYVEREGNALVLRAHIEDGFKLGQWVSVQRVSHKQGDLDPERQRRLEALRGWVWRTLVAQWEQGFNKLQRYVEREGDARMPGSHIEDGFKLGQWVSVQRVSHKQGDLGAERQRRLEALGGWVWDTLIAQWEEGFAKLQRYVEREGDARVPQRHIEDGFRLGQWVTTQRASYTRHKLEPERQRRLAALKGWVWDARPASDRRQPRHPRTGV